MCHLYRKDASSTYHDLATSLINIGISSQRCVFHIPKSFELFNFYSKAKWIYRWRFADRSLQIVLPFCYCFACRMRKKILGDYRYLRKKKFISILKIHTLRYHIVASTSPSRTEAHAGLFRSLMKGIFDPYVLWPFDKKLIF